MADSAREQGAAAPTSVERYALDANSIAEDFLFSRNPARLLLREARQGRIRIVVPQVAFDEAVNLFRESVEERRREAQKALRRLQGLGVLTHEAASLDLASEEAAKRYADDLRAILRGANATLLPYPSVSHEDVTRRALDRRRPFDPQGKDGYRDTLVWETLVESANDDEPIVLISGDNAAFSGSKGTELRPELLDELEARGLSRTGVRRIRSISDYTDTLPTISEKQLEFEHLASTPGPIRDFLLSAIEAEAFDYSEDQTSVIGLRLDVDQLFIDSVDGLGEVKVAAARQLEDDVIALNLVVEAQATLEVHVWKADAYGYDGDDLRITDYDFNESFATGVVERLLRVEVEAQYEPASRSLRSAIPYNFIPSGSV
jgi:PIN domain